MTRDECLVTLTILGITKRQNDIYQNKDWTFSLPDSVFCNYALITSNAIDSPIGNSPSKLSYEEVINLLSEKQNDDST